MENEQKKNIIIGILMVIVILSFAVIGFLLLGDANDEPVVISGNPEVTATPSVTSTPTPTTSPTATPSVTVTPVVVKESEQLDITDNIVMSVYFYNEAEWIAGGRGDLIVAKQRTTTRKDVAAFAVEEIIKGPTAEEMKDGLDASFGEGKLVRFTNTSNCSGRDFKVSIIDRKATVQFCRSVEYSGDFSGSFITSQIVSSINQFRSVDQTRVLTREGVCFNDMSGRPADQCYQ